ncbi:hypothetical protein SNEBB_000587 [Seison nebaliae]|nr:hypothetical protein SNEBB_000587 [Seison nebaliae]
MCDIVEYPPRNTAEAVTILREWRLNGERKSEEIIDVWETYLDSGRLLNENCLVKIICTFFGAIGENVVLSFSNLLTNNGSTACCGIVTDNSGNLIGLNEKYFLLEQVYFALLDCNKMVEAERILKELKKQFPKSQRVEILSAMFDEADGNYKGALSVYESMTMIQETSNESNDNTLAFKRMVAIYKSRFNYPIAIELLTKYLKLRSTDKEAWIELSELYLNSKTFDLEKAAFCVEELLLLMPHNPVFNLRYGEILYSSEKLYLAKYYFCRSIWLYEENNVRSIYGLLLTLIRLRAMNNNGDSWRTKKLPSSNFQNANVNNSVNSINVNETTINESMERLLQNTKIEQLSEWEINANLLSYCIRRLRYLYHDDFRNENDETNEDEQLSNTFPQSQLCQLELLLKSLNINE